MALLSAAEAPTEAASPKLLLNLGLGLVIGGLLGVAVAIVRELLDRRIRGAGDLAEALGAPVLAEIGSADGSRGARAALLPGAWRRA